LATGSSRKARLFDPSTMTPWRKGFGPTATAGPADASERVGLNRFLAAITL
jgi:hypothetical protein